VQCATERLYWNVIRLPLPNQVAAHGARSIVSSPAARCPRRGCGADRASAGPRAPLSYVGRAPVAPPTRAGPPLRQGYGGQTGPRRTPEPEAASQNRCSWHGVPVLLRHVSALTCRILSGPPLAFRQAGGAPSFTKPTGDKQVPALQRSCRLPRKNDAPAKPPSVWTENAAGITMRTVPAQVRIDKHWFRSERECDG